MYFLIFQGFLAIGGVLYIKARAVAWYLQWPLAVVYFVLIIKTAVLRFNDVGTLASMSQALVYPKGVVESDRTYVDDGIRIKNAFIWTIFLILIQVPTIYYAAMLPTKNDAF